MWNKIYLLVLAISLLIVSSLYFYAYTWLQSVDAPINVAANYENYSGFGWMFLWVSSIVLLVIGNVLLWREGKSWGLWTTFLYFALFVIAQTFWLDEAFNMFKSRNGLATNNVSLGALVGVILCALAAAVVFFDQFLVSRMHKKMFGVAPEEAAPANSEI